jgi:hypothetical protein
MAKKITALFVLAVFLLSLVPMAFAEKAVRGQTFRLDEGDSVRIEGYAVSDNEEDSSEEDSLDEAESSSQVVKPVKKIALQKAKVEKRVKAELVKEEVREEIIKNKIKENIIKKNRLENFIQKTKKVSKEELVKAKKQYALAKEHLNNVREKYISQRAVFKNAKEEYKDCVGVESDECEAKRAKIKKEARPYLLHAADLVLKELERVKAKVESSEDLSQEEAENMLAELNEKIRQVEEAKGVIENINEESSAEEVNEAAETIRTAWEKTKITLKRNSGRLANARLGNIILKTEILEKRIYKTRDRLEAKGLDVSALDEKINEFSTKLDEAAALYKEAREKWSASNTPGEVDDAAKDVHELLVKAKESLKDARELLREIVKEIKRVNNNRIDLAAEEEVTESEETTEDSAVEEEEETAETDNEETTEDSAAEEETAETDNEETTEEETENNETEQ